MAAPVLSVGQRRTDRQLGSASAVAGSKQTLPCTYLCAVLLVGLGLNALFGWSWAGPVPAVVIAAVAVQVGSEARRGDGCYAPSFVVVGVGGARDQPAGVGSCGCGGPCRASAAGAPSTAGQ